MKDLEKRFAGDVEKNDPVQIIMKLLCL